MIRPGKTRLNLSLPQWRSRLVLVLLLCGFVVLAARAFYLQVIQKDFLLEKGSARYSRVLALSADRGMITDRLGEPLAISTPMHTVAAAVNDVKLTPEKEAQLLGLLGMRSEELKKKVTGRSGVVFLKRQLPPEEAEQVMRLEIPGIFLQREYRRYYPAGESLAHVVGFTNIDGKGQEGMELAFETDLAGKPGSRRVIRDRKGHIIEDGEDLKLPVQGKNLPLAIDLRIQHLAHRELLAAVERHGAKAGAIVVLDAKNGEVLALANVPTYNPNNRSKLEPGSTRNRVITDMFEPGSIMKPFSVAAALEAGKVKPDAIIDVREKRLQIGNRSIGDAHPEPSGVLNITGIIQKSSNVGTAKLALQLSPEYLHGIYSKAGFGVLPRSGFPGESKGILRPWKDWKPIEQATMSFGHGVTTSLLQMARAYTVFTNDGYLMPVSMLRRTEPVAGTPVFSPQTANTMREMMAWVTRPGGTATSAAIRGYRVAGKTGTAQKEENGRYAPGKYIASFVGFAPASNPRFIVAVMVDEPTKNGYYGGQAAGPVFKNVMEGSLRILDIPPDWPEDLLDPPGKAGTPAPGGAHD